MQFQNICHHASYLTYNPLGDMTLYQKNHRLGYELLVLEIRSKLYKISLFSYLGYDCKLCLIIYNFLELPEGTLIHLTELEDSNLILTSEVDKNSVNIMQLWKPLEVLMIAHYSKLAHSDYDEIFVSLSLTI